MSGLLCGDQGRRLLRREPAHGGRRWHAVWRCRWRAGGARPRRRWRGDGVARAAGATLPLLLDESRRDGAIGGTAARASRAAQGAVDGGAGARSPTRRPTRRRRRARARLARRPAIAARATRPGRQAAYERAYRSRDGEGRRLAARGSAISPSSAARLSCAARRSMREARGGAEGVLCDRARARSSRRRASSSVAAVGRMGRWAIGRRCARLISWLRGRSGSARCSRCRRKRCTSSPVYALLIAAAASAAIRPVLHALWLCALAGRSRSSRAAGLSARRVPSGGRRDRSRRAARGGQRGLFYAVVQSAGILDTLFLYRRAVAADGKVEVPN